MKQITRTVFAGAAALLLLQSGTVGAGAAGSPAAAGNKPHETTDTLFSVASVSKVFVTAAVMQLADQGKLDIDAPVTDYLPEFRLADPRYKQITVRMLMNHRSGLMGSFYADSVLMNDRSTLPHDRFLQNISAERLKAEPGAYGAYCNDGFNLLELIAERVSGESYTDYLENHICRPLGLQQTGTPWNAFDTAEQTKVFLDQTAFSPEYCMTVGDGGVLSTAAELSRFGSAFFTGNTELLSEKAKNEMRTCQSDDPYEDGFGLGWDMVGYAAYDDAGVQVLSKGGDLAFQHAELLVAPDEEISIGVVSAGGSSSYNTQLAMALMDIALEEKGIQVSRNEPEKQELTGSIPEKYLQYEGVWVNTDGVFRLTFPQHGYMKISNLTDPTLPDRQFMYTAADSFAEVLGNAEAGKVSQPAEPTVLRFRERNGSVYLTKESVSGDANFGWLSAPESYYAQQLAENPVSEAVQAAWDRRDGKRYYLCNECASSSAYTEQVSMKLDIPAGVRGYVNSMKIRDGSRAESALQIPSSANRDLTDAEIVTENGAEYLVLDALGEKMIAEDAIPDLPADIRTVQLTSGAASWYNTDRGTVTLDIPENAAVYVYDRHDRLTYSVYFKNCGRTVTLPPSGKIVFVGETGSSIGIRQ